MIKAFLSTIRYNYFVSKLLVFVLRPVFWISGALRNQIEKKIKVNGTTLRYDSVSVNFPKNVGVGLCSSIYWKGEKGFEPHTWKAIKGACKQTDFFLDIGSNFGFYSVLVQKLYPSVKTICFEPFPALYFDNITFHKANGLQPSVVNKAVSASNGHTTLFVPRITFMNDVRSATLEKDFFYNRNKNLEEVRIETVTMDSLLTSYEQLRGHRVFVKIDVEGHERAVLTGGRKFIEEVRPLMVCEVDLVFDTLEFLSSYVNDLRYTCFAISATGLIQLQPLEFQAANCGRDFLLVPNEQLLFNGFLSWKSFDKISFSRVFNPV
jgi:FkbM family methyltransferase